MTEEERKAKDAARKREAYARRKKQEEQARMQDFRRIAQATPNPLSKEQQEQAVQQILDANPSIIVTDKSNLHELEEAFRKAQGNSEISPVYQDNHKDELAEMLAASEERRRRVELIMSMYEKDAANMTKLLYHLIENIILMRLELTDMIGGLRNGK